MLDYQSIRKKHESIRREVIKIENIVREMDSKSSKELENIVIAYNPVKRFFDMLMTGSSYIFTWGFSPTPLPERMKKYSAAKEILQYRKREKSPETQQLAKKYFTQEEIEKILNNHNISTESKEYFRRLNNLN